MPVSRTEPSDWMWTDGNDKVQKDNMIKTARGWEKVHPNGQQELIHAFTSPGNLTPLMISVTNMADGTYDDADVLTFSCTYGEIVNVSVATPFIYVYTEEGAPLALNLSGGSGTDTLIFSGPLTGIADGQLVIIQEINDNGATIQTAGAVDVSTNFPEDYEQPEIYMVTP